MTVRYRTWVARPEAELCDAKGVVRKACSSRREASEIGAARLLIHRVGCHWRLARQCGRHSTPARSTGSAHPLLGKPLNRCLHALAASSCRCATRTNKSSGPPMGATRRAWFGGLAVQDARHQKSEPRGWPRFSEPGSRSDRRFRGSVRAICCSLLRLRRAGLKTGATPRGDECRDGSQSTFSRPVRGAEPELHVGVRPAMPVTGPYGDASTGRGCSMMKSLIVGK